MTTPSPQPGWFPDPSGSGGQRYFDGTKWTEHRAAGGVAPAANKPPTVRIVGAIIGGLLLLGVVTSLGDDKKDDDASSSSASTTSSAASSRSSFVAAPAPSAPPTPAGPVAPTGVNFHTEPGSDGEVVFAKFKIADAVFMGLTKFGARRTTIDALEYAQAVYPTATKVFVQGTFATKDAYGNSDPNTVVLNVGYTKATLDKINFAGVDTDQIWDLRDSGMVHPDLQG